ncbi:MAG: hypothetical protein CXZ00_05215 [Acidobacteria bacterium]|mgnify:CR=1 FL=1|nr:MAG: hypothetical protein CXZ00_05215 [Acidobacteriota bacterium]
MQTRNSKGEVVAEQNVSITKDGTVVSVNTMFDHGKPVSQTIAVRDDSGNVRTETVLGGKLLP